MRKPRRFCLSVHLSVWLESTCLVQHTLRLLCQQVLMCAGGRWCALCCTFARRAWVTSQGSSGCPGSLTTLSCGETCAPRPSAPPQQLSREEWVEPVGQLKPWNWPNPQVTVTVCLSESDTAFFPFSIRILFLTKRKRKNKDTTEIC
jgi:hypothetical protein